jgi:hypothetical protein
VDGDDALVGVTVIIFLEFGPGINGQPIVAAHRTTAGQRRFLTVLKKIGFTVAEHAPVIHIIPFHPPTRPTPTEQGNLISAHPQMANLPDIGVARKI